jgi:hypothetical protein
MARRGTHFFGGHGWAAGAPVAATRAGKACVSVHMPNVTGGTTRVKNQLMRQLGDDPSSAGIRSTAVTERVTDDGTARQSAQRTPASRKRR